MFGVGSRIKKVRLSSLSNGIYKWKRGLRPKCNNNEIVKIMTILRPVKWRIYEKVGHERRGGRNETDMVSYRASNTSENWTIQRERGRSWTTDGLNE